MRIRIDRLGVVLVTGLLVGCSGEVAEDSTNSDHGSQASRAPNTTSESVSITLNADEDDSAEVPEFIPQFAERDPFAPLEVLPDVEEPEPEPEPEPTKPERKRPPIKLLGFVKVGSERAMLRVNEELVVVGPGDAVSGVEIVAVTSPELTVKFGDDQYAMNLFESAGMGETGNATGANGPGRNLVQRASTRTTNPRITVPTLPTQGKRSDGIPGLPSAIGRPVLEFPKVGEEAAAPRDAGV